MNDPLTRRIFLALGVTAISAECIGAMPVGEGKIQFASDFYTPVSATNWEEVAVWFRETAEKFRVMDSTNISPKLRAEVIAIEQMALLFEEFAQDAESRLG